MSGSALGVPCGRHQESAWAGMEYKSWGGFDTSLHCELPAPPSTQKCAATDSAWDALVSPVLAHP